MRRWKIIGLVSLMIFSLLGIIWVQLIWINNALLVRNDLFRRSVYQSLQNTAQRIESTRQMEFYRRMMVADSLLQSQAAELLNSRYRSAPLSIDDGLAGTGEGEISRTTESFSIRVTEDEQGIVFSGDYQSWITGAPPSYSIIPDLPLDSQNAASGDIKNEVVITDDYFQKWLIKKSGELRRMGNQMISEIYDWEVETETDRKEVYNTLQDELSNSGIETPFEFAIIEDGKIVDGVMSTSNMNAFLTSNFSVPLFTDRLIRKNTRLSLVFPKKNNFILGSMSVILGASMLFSVIILITFALSLFFILRQKKMSEMKSDFINNMTHEFKTPIATISLAADTISNAKVIGDHERVRHFISMIKQENTRMNRQVEKILQISSLDKNEMDFNFEKVDLHRIIKQSINTIGIQVEGRQGNIYFYPEAENPVCNGDAEHLTNLVHNLLDNANKYSESEPEITVRTENRDGYLMVSVEDKGIGMSKSVQSRIFERFYRQSSGNIHNVKGFGLGLSYVRAIVEAHEGRIELFSEPGRGSRFEIFLPQN